MADRAHPSVGRRRWGSRDSPAAAGSAGLGGGALLQVLDHELQGDVVAGAEVAPGAGPGVDLDGVEDGEGEEDVAATEGAVGQVALALEGRIESFGGGALPVELGELWAISRNGKIEARVAVEAEVKNWSHDRVGLAQGGVRTVVAVDAE